MKSMLQVSVGVLAAVRRQAAKSAPDECCGVLLGSTAQRSVERAWVAQNIAATPRRAFVLAPEAYLAAEHVASSAGLDVVGVYHSHPHHDARPSTGDAFGAVPSWVYLIVGGADNCRDAVRVWRFLHAGRFVEEAWVAV